MTNNPGGDTAVERDGPWHVSAGTWEWVRSMYGLAMHATGAELDTDLHLRVFDEALAARDRRLIQQERLLATAVVFDELIRLAERLGALRVSDLEGVRRIIELGIDRQRPAGSPVEQPPAAGPSESV